jgi:hypothetical protein
MKGEVYLLRSLKVISVDISSVSESLIFTVEGRRATCDHILSPMHCSISVCNSNCYHSDGKQGTRKFSHLRKGVHAWRDARRERELRPFCNENGIG